tara:strand:- start:196 stop:357 length:162 start_codon:yes stop_codon:yes gene_type:complete
MKWTCCDCEKQVDEKDYDLDERVCQECLDDELEAICESIKELHPQPIIKNEDE